MSLQIKMEEEEIDSWYEEEKQKCMDNYLKDVETTKNYEESEKKYTAKLNKIMNKYNKLMTEKLQNQKMGKLKKFISKIKTKLITILILTLLLSSGCSINKTQAETKAIEFVNQNVKFFAREENSTLDLPNYNIESITIYEENKNWIVLMHVFAALNNETKKNDLVVKLNRKGDIIEFNGREVPR